MTLELRHANEIVTLSVGGREFVTFYGTLANSRSTYFEYMFQIDRKSGLIAVHHQNIIMDERNRIFIDRDGELFAHILQYFRDGKRTVLPDDTSTLRRLAREAEFFNLDAYRSLINDRLRYEDHRVDEQSLRLDEILTTVQKISQQLYITAFQVDK